MPSSPFRDPKMLRSHTATNIEYAITEGVDESEEEYITTDSSGVVTYRVSPKNAHNGNTNPNTPNNTNTENKHSDGNTNTETNTENALENLTIANTETNTNIDADSEPNGQYANPYINNDGSIEAERTKLTRINFKLLGSLGHFKRRSMAIKQVCA